MSDEKLPVGAYVEARATELASLAAELAALDPALRARLAASAFDPAWLVARARALHDGSKDESSNRIQGSCKPPEPDQLAPLPKGAALDELRKAGEHALARGELALCVLAGGMATRMGGVVKALIEIAPGVTFLDARLAEQAHISKDSGHPLPLWLMTSESTDGPIRKALASAGAPAEVATFRQGAALRLDDAGHLFRDAHGVPSPYATGHGDLVDALRTSGLLDAFLEKGGRWLLVANLDNLGAAVDPAYLGACIASGAQLLVEVCPKEDGDHGGIPVEVDGKVQVLEEFRLPEAFAPDSVRVFNTNTMWIRADVLAEVVVPWQWFLVKKKVDGKTAIQFERLLQELTGVLDTRYVEVPRHDRDARFLPVKDMAELERRRPELEAIARAHGLHEGA
ncbi:MAG: UTP--glucose-1-phosphate uridylyltransferase [Polyangia bacterium]